MNEERFKIPDEFYDSDCQFLVYVYRDKVGTIKMNNPRQGFNVIEELGLCELIKHGMLKEVEHNFAGSKEEYDEMRK
jgi:hypothetical protein